MKTTNKLLLVLIIAILLIITIFIGMIKYYQIPESATLEEISSNSFLQEKVNIATHIFSPVTLLLLPR